MHALGCAWLREGMRRGRLRDDLDVDGAVHAVLGFFTGVRAHGLLLNADLAGRGGAFESMLALMTAGVTSERA